jgi:hypothetical protein
VDPHIKKSGEMLREENKREAVYAAILVYGTYWDLTSPIRVQLSGHHMVTDSLRCNMLAELIRNRLREVIEENPGTGI